MYGTIARIKVKPGMLERLMAWGQEQPADAGAMLIYQSDHDPNELWLVIAAESREAYRARSESPEQHEQYLQMMQYLAAEPEWHDGEVVDSYFNA
jgi:hypothetical protein